MVRTSKVGGSSGKVASGKVEWWKSGKVTIHPYTFQLCPFATLQLCHFSTLPLSRYTELKNDLHLFVGVIYELAALEQLYQNCSCFYPDRHNDCTLCHIPRHDSADDRGLFIDFYS